MKYRSEIDGLRALAVIPVILFHAGFNAFDGGFLGVDVFFVISGYLITSLVLAEKASAKFSLINFYQRRTRRILPALYFVLLIVSILAAIIMLPTQLKDFGQSVISTTSFTANIYFWLKTDYWTPSADLSPLIHMWSLGIEEQFYIFFPLLLIFIKKINLRIIFFIILVFSFSGMLYFNSIGNVSEAFYLLPFRAWELVVGAIAAISRNKLSISIRKWTNFIALIALIASYMLFDKYTHPVILYGIPVVATYLIISLPTHGSFASKILKNSYLVYIGLISYSLYLFHQPFFALLRLVTFGPLSLYQIALCLVATFFMAVISYRFVETPFRNQIFISNKSFIFLVIFLTFLFLALGTFFHFTKGLHEFKVSQMKPQTKILYTKFEKAVNDRKEKVNIKNQYLDFDLSNKTKILFVGDSISEDLLDASLLSKEIMKKAQLRRFALDDKCIKNFALDKNEINNNAIPCKKIIDLFFNSSLFNEAQVLILAEGWFKNAKYLDHFLGQPEFDNKKIVIFLSPYFSDMSSLLLYRDKSQSNINSSKFKKFVYYNRLDRAISANKTLQNIATKHSINTINGYDFFCDSNLKECTVIDNFNSPLIIDQVHLSNSGLIKFSAWFTSQLNEVLR